MAAAERRGVVIGCNAPAIEAHGAPRRTAGGTKITERSLPESGRGIRVILAGPLEPNRAGQRWLGCNPALRAPYESIDGQGRSERGWITPGGRRFVG